MKIFISFFIFILLLIGCRSHDLGEESIHGEEVNQLDGVSIEFIESHYQPEGDHFTLKMLNDSENEITYGEPYTLEYKQEDVWYEVEPDEEISFIMIAHILGPGEEVTEEVNLEFYEPLKEGHYRLLRQVDDEMLTAEFEVTEEN